MKSKIKLITITGIFTAIVYVLTAYLHIPSHAGYIHVGDGVIFFAACFLPLPYAAFVGGAGALLADCLTGFAIWAPASVVIKVATVMFFSAKKDKIISTRNILALIPATLLCAGGYYLYEALILADFRAPLVGIIPSLIQSASSGVLFIALGLAADRTDIKGQIRR